MKIVKKGDLDHKKNQEIWKQFMIQQHKLEKIEGGFE
jgi:hypothetical protein